ncbi:DUF1294 domain-containing protein [Desulfosporosinus sp. Sb-LF]|uniref:DUF1294 domain-containing protein n=1 Tax=Desulfosporosinus sp. Sb-LF TaxID=2560027 RepID=UPI00107F6EFA|nr:DUF1294 domain-containing protein [Desulfosporosinus sp. Sb-LF]TGE34553.1 DUF1294 domain-containing protein [Desulfosporosinus sp. Sb-LF]
MPILKVFVVVYVIWNGYVFVAMGRDKRRARLHRWRISEASLLWMGAAFGGVGLYTGMKYFRHKTAHSKFVIGAPVLIVVNFLVISLLLYTGHFRLNLF